MRLHSERDVFAALTDSGVALSQGERAHLSRLPSETLLEQVNPTRHAAQALFQYRFELRKQRLGEVFCVDEPVMNNGALSVEANHDAVYALAVFIAEAWDDIDALDRLHGALAKQSLMLPLQAYLEQIRPAWLELLDISINSEQENKEVACFLSRLNDPWALREKNSSKNSF